MKQYLSNMTKRQTPQSAPLLGTDQVPNSAGGYAWQVDQWARLRRFLILGSEGGTYYVREQELSIENAQNVLKCIEDDGLRTVQEIVTISDEGRAPQNDPAIFALALAASLGNDETRKAALDALPQVCRIGTHLFSFAGYINGMRGWGRGLRRSVGAWYTAKPPQRLAYQVVKYRQRNGWTHMDMLRLAHPNPVNEVQGTIFKWVTRPDEVDWNGGQTPPADEGLAFIWAFEQAQRADDLGMILQLIEAYDLPREALPTQWLTAPEVWAALLEKMPMTAMIRNLGVMSKIGLLTPLSEAENTVTERLGNAELLRKARVHPIAILLALRTYAAGCGLRGKSTWQPTSRVIDALDGAFDLAFQNIEPTGKRWLLALDVSGSMSWGNIAGTPLTPRDASAAMAMVTARTESNYSIVSFQKDIVPLNISAKMRLDKIIQATSGLPFGGTDCAQPMLYALRRKLAVDTFVVYTDSETWAGNIHPVEALRDYREKMGIPARLVVVGMVSNGFTIADPNDAGMLDVVGFDTATPNLMADFARGEL